MNDYYDRDGLPITEEELVRLRADPEYIRVARTSVTDAADPAQHFNVSTVWLGIDHKGSADGLPIIFETLVISAITDDEVDGGRWHTLAQAQDKHREFVVATAATLTDPIVTDLEGLEGQA